MEGASKPQDAAPGRWQCLLCGVPVWVWAVRGTD
jgi:hypothetical protein